MELSKCYALKLRKSYSFDATLSIEKTKSATSPNKKGWFPGEEISLLLFLRLFEDPVPKHDENHQGYCENDHGFKFYIKVSLFIRLVNRWCFNFFKITNTLTFFVKKLTKVNIIYGLNMFFVEFQSIWYNNCTFKNIIFRLQWENKGDTNQISKLILMIL